MKQKTICLLLICLSFSLTNKLSAQSYPIQSLEGTKAKINLNKLLNGRLLAVSYLTDTVFVEARNIEEVTTLGKTLLQVTYSSRGGTEFEPTNTMILTVSKNKLNVAMSVLSGTRGKSSDEKNLYQVKFNLKEAEQNNYKLFANIYTEKKSNTTSILSYDRSLNIFYNAKENIAKYSTAYHEKTKASKRQLIKGVFPAISFGNIKYYFIKGQWYITDNNNNLVTDYSRSSTKS